MKTVTTFPPPLRPSAVTVTLRRLLQVFLLLLALPSLAGNWRPEAIAQLQYAPHDYVSEAAPPPPPPPPPPANGVTSDATGQLQTAPAPGTPSGNGNPFFANLGTNGRTCNTCHQIQDAWSVNAADVQSRFNSSSGNDPIFRPVDGATCSNDNVSTLAAKQSAYTLLLSRGLIRIGLPIPSDTQFAVTINSDTYGCNSNPSTGLTSSTTGTMSMYRRPLPAANLDFLSGIMWDGREPSLSQQAIDATLGHAQATTAPTSAEVSSIVAFESGQFTGQITDDAAGSLTADGATGGATTLVNKRTSFFIGINDPFGANPTKAPFNPNVFDLYKSWSNGTAAQQSVARGENLFNTRPINIAGVGGLNDALGQQTIKGSCSTCHDVPDVGNMSVDRFMDTGVADAGAGPQPPPPLNLAGLPVFTLKCFSGSLTGKSFTVTDPGHALVTGQCSDIGHVKVPVLRGLAGRAPYFHNGSAASIANVVDFYNGRFKLNLSSQERQDLINFLQTL